MPHSWYLRGETRPQYCVGLDQRRVALDQFGVERFITKAEPLTSDNLGWRRDVEQQRKQFAPEEEHRAVFGASGLVRRRACASLARTACDTEGARATDSLAFPSGPWLRPVFLPGAPAAPFLG